MAGKHLAPVKICQVAIWLIAIFLLGALAAHAGPRLFDSDLALPPVIEDATAPQQCTVVWLMRDVGMNDAYAARMRIAPDENARPVKGLYPCPRIVPPRIAARALDTCSARAAHPRTCVFADMSRGFENEAELRNTAENAARCASDVSAHIAMACWNAGAFDVCNVACGNSETEATGRARQRCAEKHGKDCSITGSVTVLPP